MIEINALYRRLSHLIDALACPQEEPDYSRLYAGLHDLAEEVLPAVKWGQLQIDGHCRGGCQEVWNTWLSELGATYGGIRRLQQTIMAVAFATDQITPNDEIIY